MNDDMPNTTYGKSRRNQVRHLISLSCGVLLLVLGIAYANPDDLVHPPQAIRTDGALSVALFIDNALHVPVWPVLFLVASSLMLLSLAVWRHLVAYAHLACGVVLAAYAMSLWWTAILNEGLYIVSASLTTFAVVVNVLMMLNYTVSADNVSLTKTNSVERGAYGGGSASPDLDMWGTE